MIGRFYYSEHGAEAAVVVCMAWRGAERTGSLILEPELAAALADGRYPALEGDGLSLESALSYAVFIAMKAEIPVVLSGDSSVWNPRWGALLGAGAAPEQRHAGGRGLRH